MQKIVQVDLHRDFDTSHSPLEQADLQDSLQCLVLCLVQTQSKCFVTLPCIEFHGLDQSYSLLWKFGKNLLLSFRAAGQGSKNLAKDIIQTCVWSRESLAVTWNSLNHSPGWLWALDLPVSASWVVRLQACSTMPRFWKSNPHSISNEGSLTSWKAFWLPLQLTHLISVQWHIQPGDDNSIYSQVIHRVHPFWLLACSLLFRGKVLGLWLQLK